MGGIGTNLPGWRIDNKMNPIAHYFNTYGKGADDTFDPIATKMGAQGSTFVYQTLPDGTPTSDGTQEYKDGVAAAANQTAINQRAASALGASSSTSSSSSSASKMLFGQ